MHVWELLRLRGIDFADGPLRGGDLLGGCCARLLELRRRLSSSVGRPERVCGLSVWKLLRLDRPLQRHRQMRSRLVLCSFGFGLFPLPRWYLQQGSRVYFSV